MNWDLVTLLSLPFIGAFNGWFTTYLGIRMLFRPRNPVRFLGFSYQAPLPKRQAEIAERIGEIVESELISYADIREQVVTAEFLIEVRRAIQKKIREVLMEYRESLPSLVQRVITDDLVAKMARRISKEVANHLPDLIDQMFDLLSRNVSIRRLIAEKVAAFELQRLEDVIFSLTSRELRQIELFCAVLGFAIGLIQLGIELL